MRKYSINMTNYAYLVHLKEVPQNMLKLNHLNETNKTQKCIQTHAL